MTAFSTARLTVRPWEIVLDNPAACAALEARLIGMLTPEVLEHLPPEFGPDTGPQAMQRWITARRDTAQVSLVETTAELIGLLFVFRPDDTGPRHIGYLLDQNAWGQGYASELVQGLVRFAQSGPPLTLHAGVTLGNPASARVLLKAGFEEDYPAPKEDLRAFTYTSANSSPD